MKVRLQFSTGEDLSAPVRNIVQEEKLFTVCEEASCPNLGHCWARGTATFMIMGDTCTRRCGFCDVKTGKPAHLDILEGARVARSVMKMKLRHVVITSVDRDDLKDCGSAHFADVIREVKKLNPSVTVEVLIPDFRARPENLEKIWDASPDIINHNVETVPSLYREICPQSSYENSLKTLRLSSEKGFLTKSGIILGLGERIEEVFQEIEDLFHNGVRLLTVGQYLKPGPEYAPLREYAKPETFEQIAEFARSKGFFHVESGPLVRSSYHAGEALERILSQKKAAENPDFSV